jgi:hypothetical protein
MNASSWFVDSFTVQSRSSSTSGGDAAWAAQRVIKGRVEQRQRRTVGPSGVIVDTVTVFLTDQPISTGDRIWLPGASTSDVNQARRMGNVTSASTKPGPSTGYTLYRVDLG